MADRAEYHSDPVQTWLLFQGGTWKDLSDLPRRNAVAWWVPNRRLPDVLPWPRQPGMHVKAALGQLGSGGSGQTADQGSVVDVNENGPATAGRLLRRLDEWCVIAECREQPARGLRVPQHRGLAGGRPVVTVLDRHRGELYIARRDVAHLVGEGGHIQVAVHLDRGERAAQKVRQPDGMGKRPAADRLVEQGSEHTLLVVDSRQVLTGKRVTVAGKLERRNAIDVMLTRAQIEPAVRVVDRLGQANVHPAERVDDLDKAEEVDFHVVMYVQAGRLLDGRHDELRPAKPISSIDLVHPVTADIHPRITRQAHHRHPGVVGGEVDQHHRV